MESNQIQPLTSESEAGAVELPAVGPVDLSIRRLEAEIEI